MYDFEGVKPKFERITYDTQIMGGRACIRGTRILVFVIFGLKTHGATIEEILQKYPDLTREDVTEAIEYVAWYRPGGRRPRQVFQ